MCLMPSTIRTQVYTVPIVPSTGEYITPASAFRASLTATRDHQPSPRHTPRLLELQLPQRPEALVITLHDISQAGLRTRPPSWSPPATTSSELQLPQCSAAELPSPAAAERRHVGSAGWGPAPEGLTGSEGPRPRNSGSTPHDAAMAAEKEQQEDARAEGLSAT